MMFTFHCPECKKVIVKKPKRIQNAIYIPAQVSHKHRGVEYLMMAVTNKEAAEITWRYNKEVLK